MLPMHPKCFEVYKRASLQKSGQVDIDGLWLLRDEMSKLDNAEMTRFVNFPEGRDVKTVTDQWYHHEPGTEYLAANPLEVPGITDLVNQCNGRVSDLVFEGPLVHSLAHDPFALLSPELRLMVLELLDTKDVANMRLASKLSRQIPQSYFHHLIVRTMPWVWEVHSLHNTGMDWHKLWCKLSVADGGALRDEESRAWVLEKRSSAYAQAQEDMIDRFGPRSSGQNYEEREKYEREQQSRYKAEADAEIEQAYAEGRLHRKKTTEISGLRNRRRVWTDAMEILKRIEVKKEREQEEAIGSPEECFQRGYQWP